MPSKKAYKLKGLAKGSQLPKWREKIVSLRQRTVSQEIAFEDWKNKKKKRKEKEKGKALPIFLQNDRLKIIILLLSRLIEI